MSKRLQQQTILAFSTFIIGVLGVGYVLGFSSQAPVTSQAERPVFLDGPVTEVAISSLQDTYRRGVKAYHQENYPAAIAQMEQVLALQPGAINAHYYLAVSLDQMGQSVDALGHYQMVYNQTTEDRIRSYAQKRIQTLQAKIDTQFPPIHGSQVSMAGLSQIPVIASGQQQKSSGIVPLRPSQNALMVEATIVNRKTGKQVHGNFILDTGATYTSISQTMAEELGLTINNNDTVRITTANGRIDVPKVVLDEVQMNGVEAQGVQATVIQVRPDSSFSGLLGLSFIRQFKMTIDPTANQLVFESRE